VPELSMCTAVSPAEHMVCWISVQCVYDGSNLLSASYRKLKLRHWIFLFCMFILQSPSIPYTY